MQPGVLARRAIGLTLVLLITTMSAVSWLTPVAAKPDVTENPTVHHHTDGTRHDHGSRATGNDSERSLAQIVPAGACVQKNLEPVPDAAASNLCTHGPDPAPPGYDISTDVAPVIASKSSTQPNQVWCNGDGTSGDRVQVIYARSSDVPSRYDAFLPSFSQWAADVSTIFDQSAARTGGFRQVRFVHDASCSATVANVVLSPAGDDDFGATVAELQALGYNRTDRKYMLFVDANVYCGLGSIENDDQPGAANANNFGPSYGRTDAGCWGSFVPAHELMHNLGGVQLSAPNASGGWHCVDEYDVMCYSDDPNYPTMRIDCVNADQENLFDCNNDDYFHTSPPSGSYLATHWNAANSDYLIAGTDNCPDARFEPDDSASAAQNINAGNTVTRAFCSSFDEDWYSFAAVAGETYRIETLNLAPGNDTVVHLYDGDGDTELDVNDNSGGTLASLITWSAPSSDTYYVKIRRQGGVRN